MVVDNIRSRAEECLNKFNLLLAIENEVNGVSNDKHEHVELRTDDQLARFQMWTGHIGVFADGHASLDYRVRDSDEAKKLMLNFLETLRNSLLRAKDALHMSQQPSPPQQDKYGPDSFDVSASSTISSSFQGTETDSVTASPVVSVSAFEQTLQNIERTIDRLYRLSVVIRRPSILSQNSKAEKFPILDDEGNANDSEFADFALKLTVHHFPEAPQSLRQRLASGIVIRRKRFLFRQNHQRKLRTRIVTTVNGEASEVRTIVNSNYDGASTIRGVRMVDEHPAMTFLSPTDITQRRRAPSQTSASVLEKAPLPLEKIMEDNESRTSKPFTNTFSKTSPLVLPKPPKPIPGSKEFECPYCCIILSIDYAKASKWRRHVMKDLEPYTCMFEQCTDHRLFFSDRRSWISHMQHTHTMQWLCASPNHEPFSFKSAVAYEEHMWATHKGSFTSAQLPLLRERSKVPTLVTFKECPLCGFVPVNEDAEIDAAAHGNNILSQDEMAKIDSDRIITHLAGHLESLSLRALPWQDTAEDCETETAESRDADGDTGLVQDGSSDVNQSQSHLPLKDEMEDTNLISWSKEAEEEREEKEAIEDGGGLVEVSLLFVSREEEWTFITLPEYCGQDRDPVLQTMLKELYLNTSTSIGNVPKPRLPAYLVPLDKNQNFFSRHWALGAIEENLCPDPTVAAMAAKPATYPLCYAVHGPGGMGKTQIATQFVATHRQNFDAVLWVNAESATRITQDFKELAISLGLVAEDSVDANDLSFTRDLLKRWLVNPVKSFSNSDSTNTSKASWLLVFDNVEDANVLNDFWPYNGPGSILITSRNPNSWSASLELKPFSITEATEYLVKLTGREVSEQERASANAIARRLGGLPLALAQMGGIIAHKNISFSDFLQSYQEPAGQQEALSWSVSRAGSQLLNYEHNVASVWAFDTLGKGALLLNVLSMLEPDGIPENVFDAPVTESDSPDIADLKEHYKVARNELLTRSLIGGTKRNKRLFVHRLVQDVARSRMGSAELRKAFHAAVSLVWGVWPFEPLTSWRQGIARWGICDELFPNVQRLKDIFQEISPSIDSFEDYEFARLLIDAGWYLYERGRSGDALVFTNLGQSICESMKLRLFEHPEYAADHNRLSSQITNSLSEISHNRGCIALETNEPVDALKYLKIFNSTMVKELAGNTSHTDMRLAISWNELGNAYMLQQNWSKGEACFRESIDEMRKLKNFQPTWISLPLINLGLAHWLQGKNDKAIAVLTEGLHDREAAYGPEDRISFITGRVLHGLGNVKYSQGLYEESHEYHRRALLHHKSTLGHRHHRTADVFVRVADHNIRLKRNEMALALLDHAIEAYSVSQHFMPERARASFKRSLALRALNREAEANAELSKCFKIYTTLYRGWARDIGVKEEDRQGVMADLKDEDLDRLITFWSR